MPRLEQIPEPMRSYISKAKLPAFDTQPRMSGPPLNRRRVALVSTAGLHCRDDRPFTLDPWDCYRIIPDDTAANDLIMSHISPNFDRSGFQQDWNVVFPLDRLHELSNEAAIGSVAGFHYSFMGANDPQSMEHSARKLAVRLHEDQVNALLLVPVWPLCTRAVGGLAHFFEEEGVPTTQISLIREHTEIIKPPRALWVPFEFGRPLGAPGDAIFQRQVLFTALKLLEASDVPVLEDFPQNEPRSKETETLRACPVNFAFAASDLTNKEALRAAFKQETTALRLDYDLALKQRGRSTFGVSRLDIQTIVCFVGAFLDGIPQNPRQDLPLALTLNFAVDDLRAYYYEAAAGRTGQVLSESTIFDNWFWRETAAARVLFAVKQFCLKSDDKMLQLVGRLLLIPVSQFQQQD